MAATAFSRHVDVNGEVVLENRSVVVERAHIIGLERTKAEFVQHDLKPLLACTAFVQAYKVALQCRDILMSKGIFQSVEVYLDTTEAYDRKVENGIQAIFRVRERPLICGEAKTEISDRDRPKWVMRILTPNMFGRGETLSASISHTFYENGFRRIYKPTEFATTFSKPFVDGSKMQCSVLKESLDNPWSCCKENVRGIQLGYNFPRKDKNHTIEWLGHWRELGCSSCSETAIDIRRQLGHTLKSSLRHTLVIDKTDIPILPKEGPYFKFIQEVAGFGGDVRFLKEIFQSSVHSTCFDKVTFGLGCQGGFVIPISTHDHKFLVTDKFTIGGPLTLRGFQNSMIGNGSLGQYLGSNCFWIIGGHVYVPLPFCWNNFGQGNFLDNFRLHGFVNAGNAFDFNGSSLSEKISCVYDKTRVSYGFGLVYKLLNAARVECNFCVPVRAQPTDFTSGRLQFGIGISTV